jgi:hypothetical protein
MQREIGEIRVKGGIYMFFGFEIADESILQGNFGKIPLIFLYFNYLQS